MVHLPMVTQPGDTRAKIQPKTSSSRAHTRNHVAKRPSKYFPAPSTKPLISLFTHLSIYHSPTLPLYPPKPHVSTLLSFTLPSTLLPKQLPFPYLFFYVPTNPSIHFSIPFCSTSLYIHPRTISESPFTAGADV